MVTYLVPPKWPFLQTLPHPFQLGWLILSIFDNVIAGKSLLFLCVFFLSASEAEVCVWHICISSSALAFHILCLFFYWVVLSHCDNQNLSIFLVVIICDLYCKYSN